MGHTLSWHVCGGQIPANVSCCLFPLCGSWASNSSSWAWHKRCDVRSHLSNPKRDLPFWHCEYDFLKLDLCGNQCLAHYPPAISCPLGLEPSQPSHWVRGQLHSLENFLAVETSVGQREERVTTTGACELRMRQAISCVMGNKKLSHVLVTQDLSQAPHIPPASSGDGDFSPWEMRTCILRGRGIDDKVASSGSAEIACALTGCLVFLQQIPQVQSCTRGRASLCQSDSHCTSVQIVSQAKVERPIGDSASFP